MANYNGYPSNSVDTKEYILAQLNLSTECSTAEEERQCSEQSAHPEYVARVTNAACSECGATEGGADRVIVLITLGLHHLSHQPRNSLHGSSHNSCNILFHDMSTRKYESIFR